MKKANFIACCAWVPEGRARADPEKVDLSKEELQRLIDETKEYYEDLEESETASQENGDAGRSADPEEMSGDQQSAILGEMKEDIQENPAGSSSDDLLSYYDFDKYDEEQDIPLEKMFKLGNLAVYASNEDDPLVTIKDSDSEDSEAEDDKILPTDNLIAVGHIDGDAPALEVYVYNDDEGSFYVHHDIMLPSLPLCMEWLNYDPEVEEKQGNMLAIGGMSNVVEVWDLDIINSLEPAFILGKRGKKKKKNPGVGHRDAVLCLGWNRNVGHILASGSVDQTVILWDLQCGTAAQQFTPFEEKVQSLKWHMTEKECLLVGACDRKVRLFDCRSENAFKEWTLDGEVECVEWNSIGENPYSCLAGTDKGTVYNIDARQNKPLWTLDAHLKACSGIRVSPKCPGCLVTCSEDESIKVWDMLPDYPVLVEEKHPNLGSILCMEACPEKSFVFFFGGNNKHNYLKLWDISELKTVQNHFHRRVGLPVDQPDNSEDMETAETAEALSSIQLSASGTDEKQHKIKKKKGHLGKKKLPH